jgi:LysM repeat protein
MSLYMVVLLVSVALALSLTFGAPGTTSPAPGSMSTSRLPATVPGLTRDEGVFLVTAADDGSRAVYFIARNTRHSIADVDLQLEQQLNPLWPIRSASREEVLAFAEDAPISGARTGLVSMPFEASVDDAVDALADPPSAVAEATNPLSGGPASSPMPHAPVETQSSSAALTVSPAPAQAQTSVDMASATPDPAGYVVQSGDNLTRLSARLGTTVQAILALNGIANPNHVYVGQMLIIPTSAPAADVVESPTTPSPTADEASEPVADWPADGDVATTYTVKAGDSAITIARRLGVDVDELLATNAVLNRNRVYVGQVLTIPGGG